MSENLNPKLDDSIFSRLWDIKEEFEEAGGDKSLKTLYTVLNCAIDLTIQAICRGDIEFVPDSEDDPAPKVLNRDFTGQWRH